MNAECRMMNAECRMQNYERQCAAAFLTIHHSAFCILHSSLPLTRRWSQTARRPAATRLKWVRLPPASLYNTKYRQRVDSASCQRRTGQANTAKLLDGSPTLMRLRELEVLEKVATSGKLNVVLGEKGLAERVVNLL